MKKFNPLNIFFIFIVLMLVVACSGGREQNAALVSIEGHTTQVDSLMVFVFINTECPICRKYQGEFKRMNQRHPEAIFIYIFPGEQTKEDIWSFCSYDSIPLSRAVPDKKYNTAQAMGAKVTPQVIVMRNGKKAYSGKIDDRIVTIGNFKSKASVNYVDNALFSLARNEEVQITNTEAVGCFIEPR